MFACIVTKNRSISRFTWACDRMSCLSYPRWRCHDGTRAVRRTHRAGITSIARHVSRISGSEDGSLSPTLGHSTEVFSKHAICAITSFNVMHGSARGSSATTITDYFLTWLTRSLFTPIIPNPRFSKQQLFTICFSCRSRILLSTTFRFWST